MNAILHRIKAWLFPKTLTKEDPNDYSARVGSEKSLNVRQVCEAAVARGGTDISAAVLTQTVESILKAMAHQLRAGHSVNADWFQSRILFKGVFSRPNEQLHKKLSPATTGLVFSY
jgi:5-enolpyruvylshikimate-3-phosphate synthase